jgi:hypothetical protein
VLRPQRLAAPVTVSVEQFSAHQPYGRRASKARHRLMLRAVHSGLSVVRIGRGNTEGFCGCTIRTSSAART